MLCAPLGSVQLLLLQCSGNKLKHFDVRYVNRKFTNSKMASAVPGLQAGNFNFVLLPLPPLLCCCAVAKHTPAPDSIADPLAEPHVPPLARAFFFAFFFGPFLFFNV